MFLFLFFTELHWWCKAATFTSNLHKRKTTHFLTTDAADIEWGAQLNRTLLSANWSVGQRKWHSNRKEMYAVFASIKHEAQSLRKAHILLQTDNRTFVVAYVQKEGGTKSLNLLNLTFQLLRLVDNLQIELSAAYLLRRYNGIADRLSRKKALPEWHLLPEATDWIFKRWINWCRENNVDPENPRTWDLTRFLANLFITKRLAYSTILVYKSAITTFCSGNSTSALSLDFLVRQVLKVISLEMRTEIWDAQLLLNWLSIRTQNLSFFEISRRTTALLLFASERRIHDLTLLRISKNFLTNLGDEIILWPAFGLKTDREHFRQSGWKLSKHPNIWLCPIMDQGP
ncbi:uncharacterized protein [Anoplolepis gracilipes]|uniref:uncharacterized protein n=1 Tax=Anoplolepis gracilipes TaxID=354296 RepID=UPI003BA0F3A5